MQHQRGGGAGVRILLRLGLWRAFGKIKHFNSYDRIFAVVIHNDPRRDLLRFDDLGIIQPQIKRVGFFVHVQSHNLPFIFRSKNILTTRLGSTAVLTATRNTRPPNSGILRKRRSTVASSGSGSTNSGAAKVRSSYSTGISRPAKTCLACLVSSNFICLARQRSRNFRTAQFKMRVHPGFQKVWFGVFARSARPVPGRLRGGQRSKFDNTGLPRGREKPCAAPPTTTG